MDATPFSSAQALQQEAIQELHFPDGALILARIADNQRLVWVLESHSTP
jgi:hypothetical protein